MISVTQAKMILKQHTPHGKVSTMLLGNTCGRVCAADITSPIDVPSFDNSAMDGYALAWDDTLDTWKVVTEIAAGDGTGHILEAGQACRIFTGAPIPIGADTVVPQEWIDRSGSQIRFDKKIFSKGSNVRQKGAQSKAGQLILKKGALLTPGAIGLLASVGIPEVAIYTPPKVAIIVTGNELQDIGTPLAFGQIYNSNGPVLEAYLQSLGIHEISTTKAIDDPEELQGAIESCLAHADILILSGGISVGDYDYVKKGLEQAGVEELFYKIKQRPGKPLYAGNKERKLIFALPGNPASVITCFNQYVKPSLLQWMGNTDPWQPSARLPLADPIRRNAGLTFFLKSIIRDDKVHILPGQESFNLVSFGVAECFAEVPEDEEMLEAGTLINVYKW